MVSWTDFRRYLKSIELRVGFVFWLFGVCNNFSYVIMLSAAQDILHSLEPNSTTPVIPPTTPTPVPHNSTAKEWFGVEAQGGGRLDCNQIGTGAVLLADIIPTLMLKTFAPGFIQKINFTLKILMCVFLALSSFIMVALSRAVWFSLFGVVLASLSSGLGEITFLSLTASYEKSSLSGWSSGTGAAGVLGALSYTALTMLVSPESSLFIMTIVPAILFFAYFLLLPKSVRERSAELDSPSRPLFLGQSSTREMDTRASDESLSASSSEDTTATDSENVEQVEPDCQTKLALIAPMLEFMIPLSLVYFFEYTINQAFHELLFFPHAFITHAEQYRWYQTIYQIGVFISRSSICLFTFRHVWLVALIQGATLTVLLTQIIYFYIHTIYVVFAIILFEGLLGGLAYVNTFYFILKMPSPQFAEYRMGAASVSDSAGITIAGIVSVPLHNYLCAHIH